MSGPTRITFFIEPTEPRDSEPVFLQHGDDQPVDRVWSCLLYTSDAADDRAVV